VLVFGAGGAERQAPLLGKGLTVPRTLRKRNSRVGYYTRSGIST
jgi:hypothetical protein